MALTLEEMAVRFTSNGDAAVIRSFNTIAAASTTSRKVVTQNFEETGRHSEALNRKLEHLGIQAAFMFASMAEGGTTGLQQLAHGFAALGFMLPGVAGVVTTVAAVIGEQLVGAFVHAREAAKAMQEQIEETVRSIGASGSIQQAATRMQALFSGDVFEKAKDQLGNLIRGGGLEAANRQLDAVIAKRNAILQTRPTGGFGDVQQQEAFNAAIAALNAPLEEARANVALLRQEYDPIAKLLNQFAAKTGEQAATGLKLAQQARAKDAIERQHELELQKAQFEGTWVDQFLIITNWVDEAATLYGKDSEQFKRALDQKAEFMHQADEDLKKDDADKLKRLEENFKKQEDAEAKHQDKLRELRDETHERAAKLGAQVIPAAIAAQAQAAKDAVKVQMAIFNDAQTEMNARAKRAATTLGNAITAGMTAAFEGGGIGGAFKAFGSTMLGAFGDILKEMGINMIVASKIFNALLPALSNPLTAGPAMFAAGLALVALGATLSAVATRSGGGGGGGGGGYGSYVYGPTSTAHTVAVAPYTSAPPGSATTQGMSGANPVVVHATIIGKDDPSAQRQIVDLIRRAQLRGGG